MKSATKACALALAGTLTLGALAACSSSDSGSGGGSGGGGNSPSAASTGAAATISGPVTIKVATDVGMTKDAVKQFNQRVAAFEKINPQITVKSQPYDWVATTFTADLAGGTLPNVFTVAFTDGRSLIANKQIANISGLLQQYPYANDFSKPIAAEGEDPSGNMWAVPIAAYGQGIHYNRALFTQAGLNPDKPPTTWAEVRSDAKAISDKTGKIGYGMMATQNTGGWILTTMDYANGGRVESTSGGKTTATINTPQMQKTAQILHDMRWVDNSTGTSAQYNWNTIHQDFAAGKIGMFISGGGDLLNLITQNNMNAKNYGLTVVPLEGDNAGALGGGTLAAVSTTSSEQQEIASVKWLDFYYMQPLTNKTQAVASAKQAVANKQPVGAPQLPIFNQATYNKQQSWIKPYVNVPLDQMTSYTNNVFNQPLVSEPAVATQDVYAQMDPVVQAVLTKKDANITDLLKTAQSKAQRVLDKAASGS